MSLLKDLLFALVGMEGEIIVNKGDRFEIVEDAPIPLEEKSAINKIVEVGFMYKKVSNFVEKNAVSFEGIFFTYFQLSSVLRVLKRKRSKRVRSL